MTLSEVRNQIYQFLSKNSLFSIKANISSITSLDELDEKSKIGAINSAMGLFEELKIVSKISDDKWILVKNFSENRQEVNISPETALMIESFVNAYRKANSIESEEVDVLNISDGDIKNVCAIGNILLSSLSSK